MPSTLLLGLDQSGVTGRLWSESIAHNAPPDSFDASIGYPGVWDVRATSEEEKALGFQNVDRGAVRVWMRKAGYVDQQFDTTMPDDGAKEIRLVPAPAGEAGPLRRDGRTFRTASGQRWQMKGYTCQTLTAEIAHGRGIDDCLDEAVSLNYNTIVSLCMDMGEWAHAHGYFVDPRDPQWQSWFETTLNKCEDRKLRIFPAMFQQAQTLSSTEKRATWDRYCQVVRGRWHVIARMGNEKDVNAWDPNELNMNPDLGGCLLSLGSYGINNAPMPPRRDIVEWEPPRDPRAKALSDSGGAGYYMVDGYDGFPAVDQILVVSEPPFFHESQFDQWGDKRWCKPEDALLLGLNIGANFEGGAFGSSASLECQRNGPVAAECARQFRRGLEAGFVRL